MTFRQVKSLQNLLDCLGTMRRFLLARMTAQLGFGLEAPAFLQGKTGIDGLVWKTGELALALMPL